MALIPWTVLTLRLIVFHPFVKQPVHRHHLGAVNFHLLISHPVNTFDFLFGKFPRKGFRFPMYQISISHDRNSKASGARTNPENL